MNLLVRRGVHSDFQRLVFAHLLSRAEAIMSFSRADLASANAAS
jgi:hypothetical protein